MRVILEIPAKRIADMMIGAVEHNSMTTAWCAGIELAGEWAKRQSKLGEHWYGNPKLYDGAFTIIVREIADEATGTIKEHRINHVDFETGLALMARKYGRHFGNMMAENDDNITHDVFLQCVVLKDLVYG